MSLSLKYISIDVSLLEPPEPMNAILAHLAKLEHQTCLLIKHRRQPFPLYEKLNAAGFSYHCELISQNEIELYIFHQSAQGIFDLDMETKIKNKDSQL